MTVWLWFKHRLGPEILLTDQGKTALASQRGAVSCLQIANLVPAL